MRPALLRLLLPMCAAAIFVGGLVVAGRRARQELDRRGHYIVNFADIECDVPPHMTKARLLDEVQYLGGLPDRLHLLDDDVPGRLTEAFNKHPRVAGVEAVLRRPPRTLSVRLRWRVPALAVGGRVVAGDGVLLPADTPAEGLPQFDGPAPRGPSGTPYGDLPTEAAAKLADYVRPAREAFVVNRVEVRDGVYTFISGDGRRAVWGVVVGDELPHEPSAAAKRERLRHISDPETDLRAAP